MPPTNEPIAQLVLPAISATGAADVVRIVVMAPVQIDAEEWRCPVEVSGLGRFFGGGVAAGDSLQALSLA